MQTSCLLPSYVGPTDSMGDSEITLCRGIGGKNVKLDIIANGPQNIAIFSIKHDKIVYSLGVHRKFSPVLILGVSPNCGATKPIEFHEFPNNFGDL